MSPEFTDLLERALRLSASERAELAGSLIDSLSSAEDGDVDEAWQAEVSRRLAEVDTGGVELSPWSEARKQILGDASQQ
jgi:putative addiction module component (TIGR02574 family)